jgi:tetratricopeptide (TPR) repeat protein
MPAWLDQGKAGPSDTVERWLHRQPQGEGEGNKLPSGIPGKSTDELEDTVVSKRNALREAATDRTNSIPLSQKESTAIPAARKTAPIASLPNIPAIPKPPVKSPDEEEEEGAFEPPPEWLQKALGTAVADVPPIPQVKTTSATAPSTDSLRTAVPSQQTESKRWSASPAEEPPPAAKPEVGKWVPLATPGAGATEIAKQPGKSLKKKGRKISDVEAEVLLKEARVYLESDLSKAAIAYQKVLDAPSMANVVLEDLKSYLEQDPDSAPLWNLLGDAYSRAGYLQDAYKAYEEALRRM